MKRTRQPDSKGRPYKRRNVTKTTYRKKSQLSAVLKPELRFNDITVNLDANSTPTEVALTTFGTGDTVLLRDGNKALIKSVEIRLRLTNSALTQSNVVRFALVVDKLAQAEQCTWGTGAAVGEVFDAATVVARRNIISAARFIILKEITVVINETSGTGGAPTMAYCHEFVKVPKALQLTSWGSSSSTIPVVNAMTLMYIGSTAAGVTDVTVEGTVRVRFMG